MLRCTFRAFKAFITIGRVTDVRSPETDKASLTILWPWSRFAIFPSEAFLTRMFLNAQDMCIAESTIWAVCWFLRACWTESVLWTKHCIPPIISIFGTVMSRVALGNRLSHPKSDTNFSSRTDLTVLSSFLSNIRSDSTIRARCWPFGTIAQVI